MTNNITIVNRLYLGKAELMTRHSEKIINQQIYVFNKTEWQILLYIMNMYIMNSNIDFSKYLSLKINMQNWFVLFDK